MTDQPRVAVAADWPAARQRILRSYLSLLAREDSPLLHAGDEVRAQVKAQLLAVIDAVMASAEASLAIATVPAGAAPAGLSTEIGRDRANAGVHPAQSLRAAALIFQAALPEIAGVLDATGHDEPATTAAVLLNQEILARMSDAARAWVDFLLDKAHVSHRDERARLSRELHDVAAPAVAVGLQNLELYDAYATIDPARAGQKIDNAKQALRDALATIRSLSAETRQSVAETGLTEALTRLLTTVPNGIDTSLTSTADPGRLSPLQTDELFLVVREAVRNATGHGRPRHLTITLASDDLAFTATVADDGTGFDVDHARQTSARVGLASMAERAALLGAHLTITSEPGRGATVTVTVPLPTPVPQPGMVES